MLDRVGRTISRYRMLAPGDRVVVAVSGGPDSVCLLDVLHELAPQMRAALVGVAHLNHKLRGEASDEDARFVEALACGYKVELYSKGANFPSGGNLEEAARNARHGFFAELIQMGVTTRVATGHTRDDQAETVLFRLMRGSGPGGMAGILPVTSQGLIRPLLEVARSDVEEYLKLRGLKWRQDATNLTTRFSRNRIRNELLPLLRRDWNPRISEALARYADISQEEERWWTARIDEIAAELIKDADGGVDVEAAAIAELPKAIARRLIRDGIRRVRCAEGHADFEHVERVLELANGETGYGRAEFDGVEVIRSFGRLRFQPSGFRPPEVHKNVQIPGRYRFGGSWVCLDLACSETSRQPPSCASLKLPGSAELASLELRTWRVGDRYHPAGKSRAYTLHELFQRAQVPSWRRHAWPIVAIGPRILWVREFGVASEFATAETGHVLQIWEEMLPNDESLRSRSAS